jgi:ABC-type multidrug transport system fused ATPase/permease subunit
LSGAPTIRAFAHQNRFALEGFRRTDTYHRPYYFLWISNRWLGVHVECLCALVILACGLGILFSVDTIDASIAGFSLTFALAFTDSMMWIVRLHGMLEMSMNSVERVQEYLCIPQEPMQEGSQNVAKTWPSRGSITFENVVLCYSPQQNPVLKGVSFRVDGGEKIGIVGRTGAGKSTLTMALYRFMETLEGSIKIDDIDISGVKLQTLRSRLTIIPQEPVLFNGTIRSNLDPDDSFSDSSLYSILKRVKLIGGGVQGHQVHLDCPVMDNGANFSVGQRGLLCLARAFLRDSKVIVIDEATASIDVSTDNFIQQVIRDVFEHATILCIAHRLRTIADYDKVLVLDQGEVVEFDSPYNLLTGSASPDTPYPSRGQFRKMCEESGEFEMLFHLALKRALALEPELVPLPHVQINK